ncbi:hypothetical protein L8Q47_14995 [Enterobacter bugandensis]|uniref:hypothetical protein n=1 Tax=Enterobacter bugandensis TaxID=881260 RepID=UPI0020063B95|nr:hypothetical protein [Enterobacter bugandensis]MCK6946310.1 hypothetical protein [Enterobacter bugandensis]
MKHTPGPWFIKPVCNATVEGNLNIIQTESPTGKGYHISYSTSWDDNEDTKIEAQANANLIAAAPDLLKELQKLREYVINVCDVYEEDCHIEHPLMSSQSAISKALGEG